MRNKLIGQRVRNVNSYSIGIIESIDDRFVTVNFHGVKSKYNYPTAFAEILELEDEDLHEQIMKAGAEASFDDFKRIYCRAINNEINYLKETGGKKDMVTGTMSQRM